MATYTHEGTLEQEASADDIKQMMSQKAHEMFLLCDKEEKGFITKRDMQRLQAELPLSAEQLEDVFDSLDDDGNGYLTLEEFTGGFGTFLGLAPPRSEKSEAQLSDSGHSAEKVYENAHDSLEADEQHFEELIEHLDAKEVFEDTDAIKAVWAKLRRDEPELLGNFEEFLSRMTVEMKKSQTDFQSLEHALRNKSSAHDEEVRKLYEEMEQQIKLEKERILNEEKARERQVREELEKELREKDRQMQELLLKHQKMEERLSHLNVQETETKQENEKLQKERDKLEQMLDSSQKHLESSRDYINELKSKQRHDKRDRAMAALQISEGIALERESLVKQLEMLREMNRKLRDERDESDLRRGDRLHGYTRCHTCDDSQHADRGEELTGEGDHMTQEEEFVDDDSHPMETSSLKRRGSKRRSARLKQTGRQGSIMSDYFDSPKSSRARRHYGGRETSESELDEEYSQHARSARLYRDLSDSVEYDKIRQSPRKEPVGANSTADARLDGMGEEDLSGKSPERVFKVVFVGDSGVGKSSFIHRFCSNTFKHTFSATIGVDFQVKNVRVDNHLIALQLWDTAGQERFRSITKQYFRKADGVFIMYDVTSETSFKNVRNWMISVQDGTEEGTVLAMIGNKIDLVEDEETRVVTTKDGAKLADEYGALFYETSARSGSCVRDSMQGVASLLREREDRELEKTLNVNEDILPKKKGCCD